MELEIFSVYDKKTQEFGRPWYAKNDIAALRDFRNEVNRPSETNTLNTNPEDFGLFKLGKINLTTGAIEVPDSGPVLISEASRVVASSEQVPQIQRRG